MKTASGLQNTARCLIAPAYVKALTQLPANKSGLEAGTSFKRPRSNSFLCSLPDITVSLDSSLAPLCLPACQWKQELNQHFDKPKLATDTFLQYLSLGGGGRLSKQPLSCERTSNVTHSTSSFYTKQEAYSARVTPSPHRPPLSPASAQTN